VVEGGRGGEPCLAMDAQLSEIMKSSTLNAPDAQGLLAPWNIGRNEYYYPGEGKVGI